MSERIFASVACLLGPFHLSWVSLILWNSLVSRFGVFQDQWVTKQISCQTVGHQMIGMGNEIKLGILPPSSENPYGSQDCLAAVCSFIRTHYKPDTFWRVSNRKGNSKENQKTLLARQIHCHSSV